MTSWTEQVERNRFTRQAATAPYNFVPLPEDVITLVNEVQLRACQTEAERQKLYDRLPNHNRYYLKRHTGYFEVDLETLAPLFVRGPLTMRQFERQELKLYADGDDLPKDGNPEFRRLVKNMPDFFYTHNPEQPVIPGSSLRGMLRQLLEIVSYGKVNGVTDKKLFFRTVDNSSVGKEYRMRMASGSGHRGDGYQAEAEGGFWRVLPDGSAEIEKCVVARVELQDVARSFGLPAASVRDATQALYDGTGPNAYPKWAYQQHTVWVQTEPAASDHPHSGGKYLRYMKVLSIKTAASPHHVKATLVLTGPMERRHLAFVFIPQPALGKVSVPNDPAEQDMNRRLVDRFHDDDQITHWQAAAFPDGQPSGASRERGGALRDGDPLFYLVEHGQLTFFGRAQMFRLPYRNTPRDLIPEVLRRAADIDLAEALFGYVRTDQDLNEMKRHGLPIPEQGSKARAYAGRVFVTDAMFVTARNGLWLSSNPIVPKILATPKPTAFQHYLVQPNSDEKNTLKHYDSAGVQQPAATVVRGHKLYWHQGNPALTDLQPKPDSPNIDVHGTVDPHSTQHTQMKPVNAGVQFKFRVYFENLNDIELGALAWVLTLPGEPGQQYCHSLGMGKSLGLGAVKLNPVLHQTDRQQRYQALFTDETWEAGNKPLSADENIVRRFEEFVLKEIAGFTNESASQFYRVPRIRRLLKMLEWRDPPKSIPNKQFMALESFKQRYVLPDPLDVE